MILIFLLALPKPSSSNEPAVDDWVRCLLADRGEGFCIFNDIAVAAAAAVMEFSLERILVVDLDVHQVRMALHFLGSSR